MKSSPAPLKLFQKEMTFLLFNRHIAVSSRQLKSFDTHLLNKKGASNDLNIIQSLATGDSHRFILC